MTDKPRTITQRLDDVEDKLIEVASDQKWLKWAVFGIFGALMSPNFGGPTLPEVAQAVVQHVV